MLAQEAADAWFRKHTLFLDDASHDHAFRKIKNFVDQAAKQSNIATDDVVPCAPKL